MMGSESESGATRSNGAPREGLLLDILKLYFFKFTWYSFLRVDLDETS